MVNWSTLQQSLPLKMKMHLQEHLKEIEDFAFHYQRSHTLSFVSSTTKIEVTICVEPDGLLFAIWYPYEEDLTYTEHQFFMEHTNYKEVYQ